MNDRARLAVFKLASCDGCQLTMLAAEDELLALAQQIDIVYFLEATSRIEPGPYDVALVEGSVTTPDDKKRIQEIRAASRHLVAIGACATAGGIQSLRNGRDIDEFVQAVYPSPEYIDTLADSTALADHVAVDFELRGCPINKHQLVELILALSRGRRPRLPNHSVCVECKRKGIVCVTVAQGVACLGPITQSGCGAICPEFNRGCYGCYGPAQQANPQALTVHQIGEGRSTSAVIQSLASFNADASEFRQERERLTTDRGEPLG